MKRHIKIDEPMTDQEGLNLGHDKQRSITLIDQIIRQRKTTKLFLSVTQRARAEQAWTEQHRSELATVIEGAAWAPFHRRAQQNIHANGDLQSALPWRFYVLEGKSCTALLSLIEQQAKLNPDSKWSRAWQSRIRDMVSGCGALIQATWLPDLEEGSIEPELTIGNMEHIAAASAAIQNVLLAAEARDWLSYWSSGGILRDPDLFEMMGIPHTEVLLGSLFLTPTAVAETRQISGGLRDERGEVREWVRWIDFS
ncbi:MAG: nitroreductase [Granulosicoccus sp.]|jgi:nitroreductase